MSTFESLWLIGYLFYIGCLVSGFDTKNSKPIDNWITVVWAAVFWPIMLGYDIGKLMRREEP